MPKQYNAFFRCVTHNSPEIIYARDGVECLVYISVLAIFVMFVYLDVLL